MKTNDTKGINRRAGRGISRLGRAVLLCLGLLAMLTMAVLVIVLAPVVLLATVTPAPKEKRIRGGGRHGKWTLQRHPQRQGNFVEEQR
jgi:hypothetical protein